MELLIDSDTCTFFAIESLDFILRSHAVAWESLELAYIIQATLRLNSNFLPALASQVQELQA